MTTSRLIHSIILLLIYLSWLNLPAWAAPQQPDEGQVKSAIILNMARYVDWPVESFVSDTAPLAICSLGHGKLASALGTLQGKTVKGHPVTVRRMNSATDVGGCHIVVIDTTDRRTAANLLDRTRRLPILTVGDLSGFSHDGGITEFYLHEGKVRFEINLSAVRQSRLKFSSQLLKVARVVRGDE